MQPGSSLTSDATLPVLRPACRGFHPGDLQRCSGKGLADPSAARLRANTSEGISGEKKVSARYRVLSAS